MTETKEDKKEFVKLASASLNIYSPVSTGPWSATDIDKMEVVDVRTDFHKIIEACRFFYRRDPLASTVINKIVDIAITDLTFEKGTLNENEYRIYTALKDKLEEFAEAIALEYYISGLVVPEINYKVVTKPDLNLFGIKKYQALYLPTAFWLRDPSTITINQALFSDKPSYFVEIPEKVVYFILHEGTYQDGTRDVKQYEELMTLYPEFVLAVKNGERKVLLDNDLIIRRRPISGDPYPLPFLYPALESMKHKRNLRRMDYSIASRVITAIMLLKLGSDEFPITEDNKDVFNDIKQQMAWRDTQGRNIERIFQLFANHTLSIEWVFPPTEAMLDDTKYATINQDIIFGMGFPRILITGETERTGSSDPEYALLSPIKSMEAIRRKIEIILNKIITQVKIENNLKDVSKVQFSPMNLVSFEQFVTGITKLYDTGNISRKTFADIFGFNWGDEINQRIEEQGIIEKSGIPEFAPQPHSQNPETDEKPPQAEETTTTKQTTE